MIDPTAGSGGLRLAAERPERTPESESAEEASGQLAFDLAA